VIVDSSALVAILWSEPDAPVFAGAIGAASNRRMSAGTYLEIAIVVDARRNPIASRRLDEFIAEAAISIEPVTAEQAHIARQAYRDFGKGSRHPAQLNFGDCFAYALAKKLREPLLFKGNDFIHTDIVSAI
jgi:ribonuclease VapC